ncbi:hypothetical protein [Zhihengliuella salsuginis]|uniref:DUF2178 domain-containing protein n=1 Tax=Zhihengliuella salsuginis TaxID=578222 RepID=A0ABQ3GB17_9MICC|nr:hypothetical protein [Zhihengliuella salsuginis]GHC99444.1 hypothetical protein GCM10008096_01590 [Zhihengliuella salsuginis]
MPEQAYRTLSAFCLAGVLAGIAARPSLGWGGALTGIVACVVVILVVKPRDPEQRRIYLRPGENIGRWALFLPVCGSLSTLIGGFTEGSTNFAVSILLFVGYMAAGQRYFLAVEEADRRAE